MDYILAVLVKCVGNSHYSSYIYIRADKGGGMTAELEILLSDAKRCIIMSSHEILLYNYYIHTYIKYLNIL